MNSTVILSIALILFAVAIFAFLLIVLIPSHNEHPEDFVADKIFHGWAATDQSGEAFLYSQRPHFHPRSGQWLPSTKDYEVPVEVPDELKSSLHLPAWNEDPILIELFAAHIDEEPNDSPQAQASPSPSEPTTTESPDII